MRAALASTALLSIGFIFALIARHSAQDSVREETRVPGRHAIDGTMRVRLGGIEQSILLRGPGPDAPILLYLHGGPGSPAIPIARTFDGELIKHFLVVHWDQRGSGKSFHLDIPTDSMTVEQLIRDTLELTDWLCERFGQEKIFLAGASWGGALGTYAVQRAPERFHAWVPIATLVHGIRGEELSYDYVRAKIVEAGHQGDLQ
ncbi:MAG: alpha/beta fold hydrolase, partial [Myxococcota bacterium]